MRWIASNSAADPVEQAAGYAAIAANRPAVRWHRTELLAALGEVSGDPRVRAAALGALVRGGTRADGRRAWRIAAGDSAPAVRRRAAELTPSVPGVAPTVLVALVGDPDPLVAEAACWAAGEITWADAARARVVTALVTAARHRDPLVREAAVAALGALGDPAGLPTVLAACSDRPAIRRRAVLALAPFEGPEVDAAIAAAVEDPDWQTRQAAEDLL
ncbi:MAG: HEAT repeat domain-containing protein [Acidimicrobiia bacterium]